MQVQEDESIFYRLARCMVSRYVQDLLAVDCLARQLEEYAALVGIDEDRLERYALGLCSTALCEACQSSLSYRRDRGFDHLQRYLAGLLLSMSARPDLREDVLQQTLCEIWSSLHLHGRGPDQPAAFLQWTRVILWRQFSRSCKQEKRNSSVSLEIQPQPLLETLVDPGEVDPLECLLDRELRTTLEQALLQLKSVRYRQVVLYTYFLGMEVEVMAHLWQVQAQDIYLWRSRALKMLRKQLPTLASLYGDD